MAWSMPLSPSPSPNLPRGRGGIRPARNGHVPTPCRFTNTSVPTAARSLTILPAPWPMPPQIAQPADQNRSPRRSPLSKPAPQALGRDARMPRGAPMPTGRDVGVATDRRHASHLLHQSHRHSGGFFCVGRNVGSRRGRGLSIGFTTSRGGGGDNPHPISDRTSLSKSRRFPQGSVSLPERLRISCSDALYPVTRCPRLRLIIHCVGNNHSICPDVVNSPYASVW